MTERGKDRLYSAILAFVASFAIMFLTLSFSFKHEDTKSKDAKVSEIEKKVTDLDIKKLDKATFDDMVKENNNHHSEIERKIDANFNLQNQKIDENFKEQTRELIKAIKDIK
jgi:septal ring factor EnvC (AmiA/AmiB activator)